MLEVLLTQKSNPMVHRVSFSLILQGEESIQSFLIPLKYGAQDCNFTCTICKHNLSDVYITIKFIQRIRINVLQADVLVKAASQKILEQNINLIQKYLKWP